MSLFVLVPNGPISMRQTQQVQQTHRRRHAPHARSWRIVGDETLVLWTPLSPREIADRLRRHFPGQSRWDDNRPKLLGTLGSRGMNIQRYQPQQPSVPRLYVEYELISDGTLLIGRIVPAGIDRAASALLNLSFLGIAGVVTYQFRSLPITLAASVVLIAIRILQVMFQRADHRFILPWYQRLLTDVLEAEDVGSGS